MSPNLEIIQGWYRSLVDGKKQNTYKLALGLSLIECARRQIQHDPNQKIVISYKELTDQWVKYYWDHTSIFKIRQSVNPNRPPEIISLIREFLTSQSLEGVMWKNTSKEIREDLRHRVAKKSAFIDNPISRLPFDHKTKHAGGDKSGSSLFYIWDKSDQKIQLSNKFKNAIGTHFALLQDIAVLAWVSFIEQFNTIPRLIQKVKLEAPSRKLSTIRKLFFEHPNLFNMSECFYCEGQEDLSLDHIVPFSFVYSDDIFNLVPACRSCNSSKNDRYPHEFFINAATARNLILPKYEFKNFPFKVGDEKTVEALLPNLVAQAKSAGFQEWEGPSSKKP